MRLAGFLLLLSGWAIVLADLILLPTGGGQTSFVLAGVAVEGIGLALVIRSYAGPRQERRYR